MRVLITGIAGFLGQNLARAYIGKGWEVWGIDDLTVGNKDWLPGEVIFKQMDVSGPSVRPRGTFNLIIHLASRKIPREGNSFQVLSENTRGALNFVRYAHSTGAKLIYLSTSDVYGKNTCWEETADLMVGPPDVMRWSYAISKMWGEQLLFSVKEDLDFNIVRLFGSYGPYHALSWTAGPQSVFISQALKQEPMTIHGDGKQRRAFQYVDDAVDGIMRVADADLRGNVFNIGNPDEPISVDDLSRMIWEMINPGKLRPARYVRPSSYKYEDIPQRVPDITKARTLLGFDPKVSLKEGLRRTIEWQKTVM